MKFRLSAEDAEALGCPREVEFDETRLGVKEAIALQKQTGFTIDRLGYALQGVPARGRDGMPLYERDENGTEKIDDAGQKIPLREMDAEALAAAVWLAVRRAGTAVTFDDFDLNLVGIEFLDGEDPGKAPANREARRATKKTSKPSSSPTSRSTPTSSTSGRGRSSG